MAASGLAVLGPGILLPGTRELESSSAEGSLHSDWSPSDIKWDCKAFKAIPTKGSARGDASLSPFHTSEPAGGKGSAMCRVEGCQARLSEEKVYYKVGRASSTNWPESVSQAVPEPFTPRTPPPMFAAVPDMPLPCLPDFHHD